MRERERGYLTRVAVINSEEEEKDATFQYQRIILLLSPYSRSLYLG